MSEMVKIMETLDCLEGTAPSSSSSSPAAASSKKKSSVGARLRGGRGRRPSTVSAAAAAAAAAASDLDLPFLAPPTAEERARDLFQVTAAAVLPHWRRR